MRAHGYGLRRRPVSRAAGTEIETSTGRASRYSRLSASTRKANTSALLMAANTESPYAKTPGSSAISAIQQASSSRSHSRLNFIGGPPKVLRETF